MMFGIGMPELILIMAIALIVIGPKKLPDLARSIGRALGEFKKATGELKSSLGVDEELGEVKHAFDEMNQEVKDAVNVNPLEPAENSSGLTMSDKTKKVDLEGKPPEKELIVDQGVESSGGGVEEFEAPTDPEATATATDEINTLDETVVKKDRGESIGDK
jgi:TatA/E family protein of Tat protein translocase